MKLSWLTLAAILSAWAPARAEVVTVPLPGSAQPTQTFLWQAKAAKATLVMIPGGEGHIGLAPGRADLGGFYAKALKPLADPSRTSGSIHVAIFDSPEPLSSGKTYPTSRTTRDHLGRIESVVAFYRQRFGKPVWLMGHSNGAVSVAEFLRTPGAAVSGAILSSPRAGTKISPPVPVPVLFLQHRSDGCAGSDAKGAVEAFKTLQSANKANALFVWIDGGSAEAANPCTSGYHMFFGAEGEATRAIDAFIAGN